MRSALRESPLKKERERERACDSKTAAREAAAGSEIEKNVMKVVDVGTPRKPWLFSSKGTSLLLHSAAPLPFSPSCSFLFHPLTVPLDLYGEAAYLTL